MTLNEFRQLLCMNEGLKLDFKREYKLVDTLSSKKNKQLWTEFINGQWDEFIRDVLALVNGNVGTLSQSGHLVIGVDDILQFDGTRGLYDASYMERLSSQQILARVNSACNPPIPDLIREFVPLDEKRICVITIPPSPYVHETTRQLETTKGEFDDAGDLHFVRKVKIYTAHTVFVRRGESVFPATHNERIMLEKEKSSIFYIRSNVFELSQLSDLVEYIKSSLIKERSSVEILPVMKKQYANWLQTELIAMSLTHRDNLVLLEITRRGGGKFSDPGIYEHTIAIDLSFIWSGSDPFFPISMSAQENARRFLQELDPYSMIMSGIGEYFLTSESINEIAHRYEEGV